MQKMMENMQVGQKIKKVREIRNYTQEYVATKLGITQESYSKIEANKTQVSTQRLEKIADILDINMLDLLAFDDKFVFNNINNSYEHSQENAKIIFVNQSENEKELYEQIVAQYKEQISRLEGEVGFLRGLLKDKI